jgi:8-oxo-dGTP diphosphatase
LRPAVKSGWLRSKQVRREYPEAPIVGVAAVVIQDNQVLLVRRGREPLKGKWSLPGGALELGESLEEGVVREVFEECCVNVHPIAVVEVFDKITRGADGRIQYHYVLIDFLCGCAGGTVQCASDAEEARWVRREQLNSHSSYELEPFTVTVIEKAFRMAAEAGL